VNSLFPRQWWAMVFQVMAEFELERRCHHLGLVEDLACRTSQGIFLPRIPVIWNVSFRYQIILGGFTRCPDRFKDGIKLCTCPRGSELIQEHEIEFPDDSFMRLQRPEVLEGHSIILVVVDDPSPQAHFVLPTYDVGPVV